MLHPSRSGSCSPSPAPTPTSCSAPRSSATGTVGSPIVWKGEWEGKPFEDKGEIIEIDPPTRLVVTHFSPMSGEEDVPENYHRLSFELEPRRPARVSRSMQGGNASEEAAEHSTANWQMMLDGLKKAAERD